MKETKFGKILDLVIGLSAVVAFIALIFGGPTIVAGVSTAFVIGSVAGEFIGKMLLCFINRERKDDK